jgi:GMP synthase (glutamine-hydrolysing)
VITPPEGAETLATGPICNHAALLYPGPAYSVQPHPEYGDDFIKGLIETRGPGLVPAPLLQNANQALGTPLDNSKLASQFVKFFKTGQIT